MATRKRTGRSRKSKATDAPDSLVIYVHGIGHQEAPEKLKLQWDLALFGRDMQERTRMAYWSDILHGTAPPPPLREKRVARTVNTDTVLARALGPDAELGDARTLARGLLGTMGVQTGGTRKKVLPLPAPFRRAIARAFLEALVGDTAAYFFKPATRKAIQQRLRDVLPTPAQTTSLTIVAHSQGSIIALEVLAALPRGLKVDQLITIGSPLGVQEVQDFLSCPLQVPSNIRTWHNFADALDPIALDKGLNNDFAPGQFTEDGSTKTVFIVDEIVQNTRSRRLDGFNPHSAAGYLAHPSVRTVAHRSARVDAHARFLVARDVAAELAVEGRQPVLIEILEPGFPAVGEQREETVAFEKKHATHPTLEDRIETAAAEIEKIVGAENADAARIDPLRRFVAAHLTPDELTRVALKHRDLRVYAVWKSARKRRLLERSGSVIHADAARASYGAFGEGICWAVLDTGARHDHPHFATHKTIEAIWDCTRRGAPRPVDDDLDRDGHGTHVAGIIAGGSKDGKHQGMAPKTKLVVYKVLDEHGEGEDAWIIKALDHIAERNENSSDIQVHGVNLSLGGPYDATVYGCGFTPICVELRRLWRAGVLVCIASGNEGQVEVTTPDGEVELNSPMSIGDPANLEDCIAVGSVNADRPHLYGISSFSSRGPTSDGRLKPDVVAPGERIASCNAHFHRRGQTSYREDSGTSMAAPHVSGLLAAFLSVRREFRGRPDEVKEILLRTCTDIRRDRYHQGHGIPNLMRMLLEA